MSDERLLRRIEKNGIRPSKLWNSKARYVYATSVLNNFMDSHQWLRELKSKGVRTIAAIQFRTRDDAPVKAGCFCVNPMDTTAAGAMRVFMEHESGLGLQVKISRTYLPPQLVGRRYYSEAQSKLSFCGCADCQRGLIKFRKIREKCERENA